MRSTEDSFSSFLDLLLVCAIADLYPCLGYQMEQFPGAALMEALRKPSLNNKPTLAFYHGIMMAHVVLRTLGFPAPCSRIAFCPSQKKIE